MQVVDYNLDGEDQDLLFKSSDGKLFSLSKARAMESKVWKDMIKLGQNQKEEQAIIGLSEHSKDLLMFFKVLDSKDWLPQPPEELRGLKADAFNSLIDAAAKYDARLAMIFIYLELKKRFWPNIDEMKDWKGFKEDGWDVTEILKFFITAQSLSFPELSNIAAKLTFLISDLVEDQTEESSKLIEFRRHYLPLHAFRKRWDKIIETKKTVTSYVSYLKTTRLLFLYTFEANSTGFSISELWEVRKVARELDEDLFNLEYKGLDELSKAEDKSE